mmetsp:Transcript_73093/g.136605  ORF Transcript_73093/g.136605 Transcript_73093/m.136605 type:complete len:339 (-) Transcript_73093:70-1086(-)
MGEQFKWNPSEDRMGQMMRQAVYMEDQVTLEHLAKQKADLEARDETGATPLHIAATQNRPAIIAWLLGRRASVVTTDKEGFSALAWACVRGHSSAVKELLAGRADTEAVMTTREKTALSLSAERGHLNCIQELLAGKASLEQTNADGGSLLMCAAHTGEADIMAALLDKKMNPNQADNEGWTALMHSVTAPVIAAGGEFGEKRVHLEGAIGRKSCMELLLLHKADVNAQALDGLSSLIIAAGRDRGMAVKRLLEFRAQVNHATARGQTALLMAAAHDLPDVVRMLIMASADVNHTNAKNCSALSLAEKYDCKEVVALLKRAGAVEAKGKKKKKKGKKK